MSRAPKIETLAEGVTLACGDCLDVLKTLDADSVDACVTDPPYHLSEIKTSSQSFASQLNGGRSSEQKKARAGFMGKTWDGGDIAFRPELWREVLRVLRPGGYLLSFGGTRTYHRMACAIEDAGFEIRDQIQWLYGSGFPKSLDVSKAIDKRKDWSALPKLQNAIHVARKRRGMSQSEAARAMGLIGPDETLGGGGFMWFETGLRAPTREQWPRLKAALRMGDEFDLCFEEAEREITGEVEEWSDRTNYALTSKDGFRRDKPASDLAHEWSGFGTALKPSHEPIVLARKPLSESTVAANVLKWGTGALNIDGCRVESLNGDEPMGWESPRGGIWKTDSDADAALVKNNNGRWPANVIYDGSDEVVGAFPETGASSASSGRNGLDIGDVFSLRRGDDAVRGHDDNGGSAARFFYTAKADSDDRLGSRHPTIKPLDLMQYLVRLVGRKGATILDPFAGSGTTGEAAFREGMRAILIEREAEYQADIRRRMKLAMAGPDERGRESIKAKNLPRDDGPLFASSWDEMWAKPFTGEPT